MTSLCGWMAPMHGFACARWRRPSAVMTPAARPLATMTSRTSWLASTVPPSILDAADQRLGELAAAAHRHAKTIGLEEAEEHEHAQARRLFIRRDQVLTGHAREMRSHPIVLEVVRQHIVAAHLHGAPELAALAALIQEGECAAPCGIGGVYSVDTSIGSHAAACADSRRKASASRFENLAICAAVRCGSRYSARVEPSSNTDIIGDSGNRYLRPIAALQAQFVPLQQRIGLDEDMRHRVLIVAKARPGQLARDHAAAQPRIALQHQHAFAALGQVCGCHQAVVPAADGDDVVARRTGFYRDRIV